MRVMERGRLLPARQLSQVQEDLGLVYKQFASWVKEPPMSIFLPEWVAECRS